MSFSLYLVSDGRSRARSLPSAVGAALDALPPGAAAVQVRERELSARALATLVRELLPICAARGARLLVNDRADVALATRADGVHLPAQGLAASDARALLGQAALLGASCHTLDELRLAEASGADFAVFGPLFATPGKGPPLGLAAFAEAARAVKLPIFALGGIDAENAGAALSAGARGVACMRAVLGAHDPGAAARELWSALQAHA